MIDIKTDTNVLKMGLKVSWVIFMDHDTKRAWYSDVETMPSEQYETYKFHVDYHTLINWEK